MPLRRGPSMKLLKRQPAFEFGQRRVPRQVDLQRSDGGKAFGNRMKIGARTRILPLARRSNPVHIASARVFGAHDRLTAMARAEARYSNSAQLAVRQVRDIHVEDDRP